MKKLLIFILVLAFFVPSLAFMASDNNVEKIPSLSELKNFTVVKKINGVLFGIRNKIKNDIKIEQKLEKISNPGELKNFGQIKKVGNALWGVRMIQEESIGTATMTAEMITCLKTAIDKKDTSTKSIITASKDTLVNLIDKRNTCQKNALDLATNPERVKAFRVCRDDYNKALKEMRDKAQKDKNAAWQTYKTDIRSCYGAVATSTNDILISGSPDEVSL